ncbi:hypothetical protein EUTSA_v10010847mg [Eutrema salsugineum]|uniref:Uncharacterized protein n=1 Tax=Eutrema salsugineum TaxID=72664 RepID=V4LTN2_EUTSA|nr:hypothetical protein EUTSA_v10010847mg [Eutrema salsugineum]
MDNPILSPHSRKASRHRKFGNPLSSRSIVRSIGHNRRRVAYCEEISRFTGEIVENRQENCQKMSAIKPLRNRFFNRLSNGHF